MTDPEQTDPGAPPRRRDTDLPADAPWWARWIVTNWNEGWKWLSVQWPIICGGLIEIYTLYGEQLAEYLPSNWMPHLAAAAFWLTAALRFINQPKKGAP